ncbi:hypothetical protein EZ428_11905 [Pedobacter frigiditerrae]|uniref:Uncharacterized protein n=1 Tax=Pedobacter frigiditerrae TaxID=2530452 RepID=A0A4R0MZJ7_9SPHI|nr:hypothetical protein [Pedobacter frigiditerrae]TCC92417.1 hypothetical protein EZ428_11905 [Pedobacter frigiditerrae]
MIETILFICTVLGTLVAIITYQKTFHKRPTDEIENLISRYAFAKELNEKVLLKLQQYASENQSASQHFMQGITFQKGINILNEAKAQIFNAENDQIFKDVNQMKIYGKQGENMLRTIEAHITHVCEVQTHFNFYFEPENKGIIN